MIRIWDDRDIESGDKWKGKIEAANTRGVIILWAAVEVSTVEDDFPELLEIEAMNTNPEQPLARLDSKELSRELKEIYKKIKAVVER